MLQELAHHPCFVWLELHSFTPDDGKIAINCYSISGVSERVASQLQKQTPSRWVSAPGPQGKSHAVQIEWVWLLWNDDPGGGI